MEFGSVFEESSCVKTGSCLVFIIYKFFRNRKQALQLLMPVPIAHHSVVSLHALLIRHESA